MLMDMSSQPRLAQSGTKPRRWLHHALIPVLAVMTLAGCESEEKTQARREIVSLNSDKQMLLSTIAGEQSQIESLTQAMNVQNAGLKEYQAEVQGYMMEHKMAVAAIVAGVAGTGVALSADNSFSEDAKNMGGIVAFIAALWAVDHVDEISEVVGTLNKADAHVRFLETAMEQTRSALRQQQQALETNRQQLGQVGQHIASLSDRMQTM